MTDERGPTADEMFYGGVSLPVNPGNSPDASNVISEMFFVADGTVLASEYEMLASRPIRIGDEAEEEVYFLITFKGKINNRNELGAFTALVRPASIKQMILDMRQLYTSIPPEYRE